MESIKWNLIRKCNFKGEPHYLFHDKTNNIILLLRKGYDSEEKLEDIECWSFLPADIKKDFSKGKFKVKGNLIQWLEKYGLYFITSLFIRPFEDIKRIYDPFLQVFPLEFWEDVVIPTAEGKLEGLECYAMPTEES